MGRTMEITPSFGLLISLSLGLALWAAAIAGTKQRSMVLFGTLTLLFPVIGMVAACVASDRTARPSPGDRYRSATTRWRGRRRTRTVGRASATTRASSR